MMTVRRELTGVAAALLIGVTAVVLMVTPSARTRVHHVQRAAAIAPVPWDTSLHAHPRVVVALSPGQTPPDAAQTYPGAPDIAAPPPNPSSVGSNGPDPATFQRPSDAEVKRELRQLNLLGVGGSGSYVNPFAQVSGLVGERIDMGVDYSGTGPVLALGSGTVFNIAGAGWPGGAFIGITLDSGPYRGRSYYVAEDVKPAVRVGQRVGSGQPIGVMYNGGSGIETGWAAGRGDEPLAAALGQQAPGDPGAWSSAAGISFDRLLVSTGAPTGIPQGSGVHGRMPPGYP